MIQLLGCQYFFGNDQSVPIARSIKKWHGGLDINLCNVSSFDFVYWSD